MPNIIPQHLSATVEHYTPKSIIECAREVMGSIELDPASCAEANEQVVKAERFYCKEDDGLSKEWKCETLWLNCPGGTTKIEGSGRARSNMVLWWSKLIEEYEKGNVKEAIFLAFNMELLRSSQHPPSGRAASAFPLCFPKARIRFLNAETFEPQGQPTHPNVIVYLPKDRYSSETFRKVFSKFGEVKI